MKRKITIGLIIIAILIAIYIVLFPSKTGGQASIDDGSPTRLS